MKLKYFKITALLVMIVLAAGAYAKPRIKIGQQPMGPNVVVQSVQLKANNIASWFHNTGVFNQDFRTTNTPGLEWPKGSNKFACFTAGLSIGCGIDGQYAQCMGSYKGEYAPGTWQNGNFVTTDFKLYTVKLGDNAETNPDYANWFKMIPYGAPFKDINNNGVYDNGIDVPGMPNAGQTLFMCMGDGDISQHNIGEGFGGGIVNPLLKVEAHFTAWAYTTPGLEDLQFVNWLVINKGDKQWDSTFMGVVVDPDLGNADDDYIGCDRTLNLGYCYNADNNDPIYGLAPPAFGMDYFKSPIIKATNDTIGMTSFVFFSNTSASPPPCESDPNGEPVPAYHMLQGLKKDRSPFVDITQVPPAVTKFCYPGDPEIGSGWTEYKGSRQNCGGINGTEITVNPPGDRRFIFNSGRLDFVVYPGDTQNIVLAQFVQRGSDNKNSVTLLKRLSKTAQLIYDNNFNVTPPPPPPAVSASFTPTIAGQCNITLSWGDASESYNYWDTIFYLPGDSNIYKFEGYEVYEINKFSAQLPDFMKPYTVDPNVLKLLDAYDLKNNIGLVVDTLPTGTVINSQEVYAPFPIVPPFNMSVPNNFPQKGISRSITLTSTRFAQNYAGVTGFVYGQKYQFAVVAYAVSVSTHIRRGFKVIRNSLGGQVIDVTPTAPPAGSSFTYKNGDTLYTTIRDLSLAPKIRNLNVLKNATYRIQFNSDTTYNIMKRLDGAVKFDTLRTNLKPTGSKSEVDEDSRTLDGIYFNVLKIRYSGAHGQYVGNFGIVKDYPNTLKPDSIQTRQSGYTWLNTGNAFLKGSKYLRDVSRPWQSLSMSVSYPNQGTFTNLRSALTVDKLRKVTIKWTDLANGQYAYWYRDTSQATDNYYIYQGMAKVPFTVWVDTVLVDDPAIPSFKIERRQVNCGFVESADVNPFTGGWNPTADTLGGKLVLYTFGTSYDTSITTPYKNRNLFLQQTQFDIMFVWSPMLVSPGGTGTPGNELSFYPYTVTRPYINGNTPLYYEFTTKEPVFGDPNAAKGEMDKIKVVPNPYYGFSTLDRSKSDKFVTFTHLPLNCVIKIYTLNGDLVKTINKSGTGNPTFNSTIEWNLQNEDKVPVASGLYVALVDAPGIGTKVLKIAIFTAQERINF
jgi:hypothetical protein